MDADIALGSDDEQDAPETDIAEEALVEEVSIDGMCGVY
jgi:mycofactocin precursor